MTAASALRRLPRAAAAAPLVIALLLPAVATPVRAADVTFGTPSATVAYGESIVFSVPYTAAASPERIELRLKFPQSIGPFITDVPVPASGTQPLTYTLDLTGAGHLVPNTTIDATWAAVAARGDAPVLSETETVLYADTSHDWRTVKGDIMTVHWYEGDVDFAQKALQIGEDAVRHTADLLKVSETEPIDFFIYGDEASFRDALGPGTRENVGGQAHADIRTLFALITPDAISDPWVGVVIPHELVHLVFDTAVRNPYRFPPRWLNEGLAVYLSEGYTASDRSLVEDAARSQDLLPLTAMVGQFPVDSAKTYQAYAESSSAIDYLVRTDGQPALLSLVLAYKDGLTDDEAFTKATGHDLAAFQAGWLTDLGARAPVPAGPAPNPSGPVPPGWGPSRATPASPVAPEPRRSDTVLVLGTVGLVVLVVIVGLVIARRRTAAP